MSERTKTGIISLCVPLEIKDELEFFNSSFIECLPNMPIKNQK